MHSTSFLLVTEDHQLRRLPDAAQIAGAVIPPLLIWLIGSALVDILIAITMSILVSHFREWPTS